MQRPVLVFGSVSLTAAAAAVVPVQLFVRIECLTVLIVAVGLIVRGGGARPVHRVCVCDLYIGAKSTRTHALVLCSEHITLLHGGESNRRI